MAKPGKDFIPKSAKEYLVEKEAYKKEVQEHFNDFLGLTKKSAEMLQAKKGLDVRAFDLTGLSQPSEYVVITSGTSTKHAQAMAESIRREIKTEFHFNPFNIEGINEGRWVVLDYGNLIIHIFYDFTRTEYRLEELWNEGKEIETESKEQ